MFFLFYVLIGFLVAALTLFGYMLKTKQPSFSTFFPVFVFSLLLCMPIVNILVVIAFLVDKLRGKKQTTLLVDVCALAIASSFLRIFSRKKNK